MQNVSLVIKLITYFDKVILDLLLKLKINILLTAPKGATSVN